jgi:hypothetical protein
MIGRVVENPNGTAYRITDIRYDLTEDRVIFWMDELDSQGNPVDGHPDSEIGVYDLESWTLR